MLEPLSNFYGKYRYQILPYLFGLLIILLIWSTLDNYIIYKTPYGNYLIIIILITVILVIEGYANKSKHKKNYHWWQIKIDPSIFHIFDFLRDYKDTVFFTWSQGQISEDFIYFNFFENEISSYIKKGDKIVFWVHGKTIGIYALGEVIDETFIDKIDENNRKYYENPNYKDIEITQLKIKFLYKFFNNPIPHTYCYEKGLSSYRDILFGGILNRKMPEKYNTYPRQKPSKISSRYDLINYKLGKLDTYGWYPIKPIWKDIWKNILEIVKKDDVILLP